MGEYESFHYLMHKTGPATGRVDYVSKPGELSFDQLYSPRGMGSPSLMGKKTKEFGDDKLEFMFFEYRKFKISIICVKDKKGGYNAPSYRTLVLDLEQLYKLVDQEKRGNDDVLKKKDQKGYQNDKELWEATMQYCLDRLHWSPDPIPWPKKEIMKGEGTKEEAVEGLKDETVEDILEKQCVWKPQSEEEAIELPIQTIINNKAMQIDNISAKMLKLAPTPPPQDEQAKEAVEANTASTEKSGTAATGATDVAIATPVATEDTTTEAPPVETAKVNASEATPTKNKADENKEQKSPAGSGLAAVKAKKTGASGTTAATGTKKK